MNVVGFRFRGAGFGAKDTEFRIRRIGVQGFRVVYKGSRVRGLGFNFSGFGFRV